MGNLVKYIAIVQAEIGNELRKVLQNAVKLQKKRNDTYLSVDTLLLAVLENKDVADALNESGVLLRGQQRKLTAQGRTVT